MAPAVVAPELIGGYVPQFILVRLHTFLVVPAGNFVRTAGILV